jgi:hypothetical protein
MRWIACLEICMLVSGCDVPPQPEGFKTVAAFEIPLTSEEARTEFLSLLRRAAEVEGMHVDSESEQDLANEAKLIPETEMTIHAQVWRGSHDDEPIATVMDQRDHLGEVWITFSKGKDTGAVNRFRERIMREIRLHWPNTLSLPIMPTGAIPLHHDLIRTPDGYIVDPTAAAKYGLEPAGEPHL